MDKIYIGKLKNLNACQDAVDWCKQYSTPEEAWNKCERGEWMLWLLGKLCGSSRSKSRKELVLTACQCARLSLKYIPKSEYRPLKAIETAEAWSSGKASLNEVIIAAYAAKAAKAAAKQNTLKQCADIVLNRHDLPKEFRSK